MFPGKINASSLLSALLLICGILLGTPTLSAAPPSPKQIALNIDPSHKTASLSVPKSVNRVNIEYRATAGGRWISYKTVTVKASPAQVRVSLPSDYARKSWRATAARNAATPSAKKYPAAFYNGKKSFKPSIAPSYAVRQSGSGPSAVHADAKTTVLASASVTGTTAVSADSASATVEESDIWKSDGTTTYLFNQLRGLQVIDLSDPANPSLLASYRLPAKGQDLYILPGSGQAHYAVLLTQEYDRTNWQSLTGVKLVKVDGQTTTLVGSTTISGWMADSRMVGNRLYLATQQWSWSNSSNQDSTTLNEITVDPVAGTLATGNKTTVAGSWPVISAGNDWLTVAESDWSDWQTSKITLFSLGEEGATQLTTDPITVAGRIFDKYNVQYAGGILSLVSQKWVSDTNNSTGWWWNGTQVTTLENFSADGTKQGSLEVNRGEQLHATRFAGNKVYVVTARQTDPLFVIDLSDAANPVVAGQVEVPGWSTHIEPVGTDKLFTIGYDANWKVAASLFDVSSPASPALLSRVLMDSTGGGWGYSSATYDDKALKVLSDAGLVLVPYVSWNTSSGTSDHYVQLLNLDASSGTLSLAGTITHRFDPLRADLIGGTLASISQRQLVTADVSNPGNPVVLADLTLAWPVNRIAASGDYLIQITDGTSWSGDSPTARVSTVSDVDSGLQETLLGDGVVKDAVVRDGKLYVLRQNPADTTWNNWYYPMVRFANASSPLTSQPGNQTSLILDIYDASKLPVLQLTGSVSSALPGSDTAWDVSGLLFASSNTVVAVAQPQARNFWWWGGYYYDGPVLMAAKTATTAIKTVKPAVSKGVAIAVDPLPSCWIYPGYRGNQNTNPAAALVFQVNDATAPAAQPPIALTDAASTPVKNSTAGGGFVVYGYADRENPCGNDLSTSQHHLRILDLTDAANPVLGPALDLPGRLNAVTDLSATGFLAWTETHDEGSQVQVSTCDGATVTQVTSLSLPQDGELAASGRTLFTVQGNGVKGYSLNDSGTLAPTGTISLDWTPTGIRIPDNATGSGTITLIGSDWNHLFSSIWTGSGGDVLDWAIDRTVDLGKVIPRDDRSVLSPAGEYGVDQFQP